MAAPRPAPTLAARRLDIRVLGPMEAAVDGRPVQVDTRKALAILALLAVERRPFARDELAAMLWPESDDESARGALRRTLSVLRAGLGGTWLDVSRSTVALEPGAWVDLAVVDDAVRSGARDQLAHAAGLARGPFLAGFSLRDSPDFDDWRATWEGTAERLTAAVLDGLSESLEAAGELAAAVEAAARRVDLNPLDEPAQRRLMLLLARTGNRTEAIRRYRACVAALDLELGVSPLSETTELYEAIRDDRVAAAAPAPPATPHGEPALRRLPLAGREAALGRALAAVRASTPDGRVIVVEGEAGIGKTRLVEAIVETAAQRGSASATARAFASERAIPYGPIVGLLHAVLTRPDAAERIASLPGPVLAEVGRLVPLPQERRPEPVDAGVRDTLGARTRLLDALAQFLTALVAPPAGGEPGILALEDLQWADAASREVIGWLSRRLLGRPVALIVTWRPEDLEADGARFTDAMGGLDGVTRIALGRLDRDAVARLLDASAGGWSGGADALYRESEGLPLYIVEALAAGGAAADRPGGVRALLRERLGSVGETGAQILSAGAVLGRTFDLRLVRDTSGRTDDEVVAALEELVRRGLVREQGDGRDVTFDFAHARIRDAAYAEISLARRRLLHRRAADAMRADASWRDAPGRLALVAGHLRAAGQEAEAATLFREAGRRARALHAHREAVTHLETAIALGYGDVADAQLAIGESLTILGDYQGAIAALEAAAAMAGPHLLPTVELRLGRAHARRGDLELAAGHLDAAAEELLDRRGDDASALLVRVLVERSVVRRRAGRLEEAAADASRSMELAEAAGDDPGTGAALRMIGLLSRDRDDLATARRALERSLALAAVDPDVAAGIAARNALALVASADGHPHEAVELLGRALDDSRRIGARHLEAAVENNLADQLHALGDAEASMDHLRRAVALFAEVGGRPGELEPEIWKLVDW